MLNTIPIVVRHFHLLRDDGFLLCEICEAFARLLLFLFFTDAIIIQWSKNKLQILIVWLLIELKLLAFKNVFLDSFDIFVFRSSFKELSLLVIVPRAHLFSVPTVITRYNVIPEELQEYVAEGLQVICAARTAALMLSA